MAVPQINGNGTVPPPPPPSYPLTLSAMGRFKPSKIFKGAIDGPEMASSTSHHITSVCFDDRGDTCITAGEDETFRLYNCKTGKHVKTLYSKKYGVDLPRFTHKPSTIVHASTKEDDTIRYHSLHDNKYLQYFKGHKQKVISLEVAPVEDGFISGSEDKTVRLWDLRVPSSRGLVHLPSSPIVAYDHTGTVFAVALNTYQRLLLYDMFNYDKEPFLSIPIEDPTLRPGVDWPLYMTSLSFSTNGKWLLIGTSGHAHYILDASDGLFLARLVGHSPLGKPKPGLANGSSNSSGKPGYEPSRGMSGEELSWTPDSKYIIGGSYDGKILVWDSGSIPQSLDKGEMPVRIDPSHTLDGHPGPSRCVKFNPRFAMVCTAGAELAFWLPNPSLEQED